MNQTTIGSLLRTTQAYCMQICEKETLDFGIAYYSTDYPKVPEANQYREVIATESDNFAPAFEEAEAFFTAHNLTFTRWAPSMGVADDAITSFLAARNFTRHEFTVLALAKWVELDVSDQVHILPARAVRKTYRATIRVPSGDTGDVDVAISAELDRLDDPQFDMFVALVDGQPAGRCALYQVGDIARVTDLTLLPGFDGAGVDTALLAHALTMARRLAIGNVCASIPATDAAAAERLQRVGFTPDGQIVEFHRE